VKKFDNIFTRSDTIRKHDRWTDTHMTAQAALCIASHDKNHNQVSHHFACACSPM